MGITDAGIWFQAADSINERLRKKTIYENLQNSFNIKKAALYWKYFNFKDSPMSQTELYKWYNLLKMKLQLNMMELRG